MCSSDLDRTGEGGGWIMLKARRTAWGEAVAWAILESVTAKGIDEFWMLDLPEDVDFGTLQPAFRPYFPEWEKVSGLQRAASQAGTYVFKASFADFRVTGEVWCRLAVPSDDSLDDLASAVLKAFKFTDTEHLYDFRYRDRLGKGRVCNHSYMDEGPYASEIEVGDTGLPEKGILKFLFDYGDSWHFELRLERIESPGKKNAAIKVLESAGKPPKQYPDWE